MEGLTNRSIHLLVRLGDLAARRPFQRSRVRMPLRQLSESLVDLQLGGFASGGDSDPLLAI